MGSAHLGSAPDMGDFESFILRKRMAKSKAGGTRTYIRGRVGSDVYSIGRDAKGKKQQVVRSLAESVSNPQTLAQMKGRMIMSTIAQAMAVLRPIIDHSFDGVVGARANISEFVSRNYALIKADVQAHAASGNLFGLNQYQEKGAKQGAYVISDGPEVGEVYDGVVRSIMPYGCFVEIMPGKDGLLHISEIDWKRLETVEEAGIKEGDHIQVKLLEIDPKTGKYKLSHRVLIEKPADYVERPARERGERRERPERGERRDRRPDRGDRRDRGERRERPERGEHRPRPEQEQQEQPKENQEPKDFNDSLDHMDF